MKIFDFITELFSTICTLIVCAAIVVGVYVGAVYQPKVYDNFADAVMDKWEYDGREFLTVTINHRDQFYMSYKTK